MEIKPVAFLERADRARYIAGRFALYLRGTVLDVGCDEGILGTLLEGATYTGIDFGGRPDLEINLEEIDCLPFEDGEFDCIVCSDVLEHLDNLHFVFGELLRVARRHVIISLPNCWYSTRRPLARGHGAIRHYGLPLERPVDRHKWFFNLGEAGAFLEGKARECGFTLAEMHATEKPKAAALRALRRGLYPRQAAYLNRYGHTLWTVLAK